MTTNLLAAIVVTLSTNTVEKVTGYAGHESAPCDCFREGNPKSLPSLIYGCTLAHVRGVDPNEKTITTTAKRTTTITFDWMGKAQSVEHSEVLWESNKVVRLEWREVPQVLGGNLLRDHTNGFVKAYYPYALTNTQPSIIYAK